MKFSFLQVKKLAFISFAAMAACIQGIYADGMYSSSSSVGVDGTGNAAVIWQFLDPNTGNFVIQGAYGHTAPFTSTNISDTNVYNSYSPILQASTNSSASTRAAAAWFAYNLSTQVSVIQVATANGTGWSSNSFTTLSATDGSELPQNIQTVSISPDGNTIFVAWPSYIPNIQDTVIRYSISVDGGNTWLTPAGTITPS